MTEELAVGHLPCLSYLRDPRRAQAGVTFFSYLSSERG
jgi:hypothetical protein